MSEPMDKPGPSKGSIWMTVKAVGWSFLGIRRGGAFQQDMAKLNPLHIIAVGVVAALLFILSLIALVNWVVAK